MTTTARRVGPVKVLLTVVVLAIALMWIYVFSGAADRESPSVLADTAYGQRAEAVCRRGRERVDALPPARRATSPQDRAAVLREATGVVAGMVEELRGLGGGVGRDDELLRQWFADWDSYVGSRHAYADALDAGEDRPFSVQAVGGQPVTERMDEFARLNGMASCQVPLDV